MLSQGTVCTYSVHYKVTYIKTEAADLSALHSVSPSFKTSVHFLPNYFEVFLWVSSTAFHIISKQYGTQWPETLTSSSLSVILYVGFSFLLFILYKFTQIF